MSSNVAIVRLGELGAPEVLAHYAGGMRVSEENQPTSAPVNTATPTADSHA